MTGKPIPVRDRAMKGWEVMEEVHHFMQFKIDPVNIARELRYQPATISRLARRHDDAQVIEYFQGYENTRSKKEET